MEKPTGDRRGRLPAAGPVSSDLWNIKPISPQCLFIHIKESMNGNLAITCNIAIFWVCTWAEQWSPPDCEPLQAKLPPPLAGCLGRCLRSRTGTWIEAFILKYFRPKLCLGHRKGSSSLFLTSGGRGRNHAGTSGPEQGLGSWWERGQGLGGWEQLKGLLSPESLGSPQTQSGDWMSKISWLNRIDNRWICELKYIEAFRSPLVLWLFKSRYTKELSRCRGTDYYGQGVYRNWIQSLESWIWICTFIWVKIVWKYLSDTWLCDGSMSSVSVSTFTAFWGSVTFYLETGQCYWTSLHWS